MKMFMVANRTSMKPIAFHMEKRVVLNYVSSYEKSNPDESLAIFKLNKNSVAKYSDFAELYLVRYGETYIQNKFLYIAQLDSDQIIYDLDYAHDVINRIMEMSSNKKKVKKLLDTLFIIDDEKRAVNQHVYSFSELNQRDADYSRFRYNTYYE